jgi:glycerophosphoryl diester phosphodiesterase
VILPAPLDRAHAHTDCRHARPLLDALDTGFTSIEADVHLVGEELLVGHDPEELRPDRTLQALSLDPLADRAGAAGGRVHPTRVEPVQLLVDVKTDPVATYLRLDAVLRRYRRHLTRFDATRTGYRQRVRAVTVVVSGNRPMDLMARQRVRYAAYDGRLADLTSGAAAAFMSL